MKAQKIVKEKVMVECDGNYWESVRNSLKRCRFGGNCGSKTQEGCPDLLSLANKKSDVATTKQS